MFKKRNGILLLVIALFSFLAIVLYSSPIPPNINSKSAILMDASNGKVLFEKDASESYPVASMSKLMTEYIVLDLIENRTIHWQDEVFISDTANMVSEGAVKIPIDVGDLLTVKDLFHAMVISSANNATIALAEYIAGTEEEFTRLMNEKALNLGLSDGTHFVNATGLPNSTMNITENMMTANDIATLAYNLLKDHDHDVLETASMQHYHIPTYGIDLYSTNKMLNPHDKQAYFIGMDGLKTGFTDAAGYGFIGTASQNGKRLISVIINADNEDLRFTETKKLLTYGFRTSLNEKVKSIIEKIKLTK